MKTKILNIMMAAALGVPLAMTALEASAATQREARVLVGAHVEDGRGRTIGTIRSVVVDRDEQQATLVIAQPSGVDEVLRVPIDATLAAQRGDTVTLIVGATNRQYEPEDAPRRMDGYGGRPYSERMSDERISEERMSGERMHGDRRLNRLVGTRVEDSQGRFVGEVQRVALRETNNGEKAFAVVRPDDGGRSLVVPLGFSSNVRMAMRGNSHPREVVLDRYDGDAQIRW